MLVSLKRSQKHDTDSAETCYVESEEIASIEWCVVGERSTGSRITLKCGKSLEVWESPDYVRHKIREATGEAD